MSRAIRRAHDSDVARIFPPEVVALLRRAAETYPRHEVQGTSDRTRAVNDVIHKLHLHYPRFFRPEALYPQTPERKLP